MRARYRPEFVARRAVELFADTADAVSMLPGQMRRLLRSLSDGRPRLRVDVEQLPEFGNQIARSANRLSLGLVIAALIVGSSIVMTVEGGPSLFGLPLFGFAGFLGSILGGLWLFTSILRSGGGR